MQKHGREETPELNIRAHSPPLLFPLLPLLAIARDLTHTSRHPSPHAHATRRTQHTYTTTLWQTLRTRAKDTAGVVHTLKERWCVGIQMERQVQVFGAGPLTPWAVMSLQEDRSPKTWYAWQWPSLMDQRAALQERGCMNSNLMLKDPAYHRQLHRKDRKYIP